jgi:hypothetical protein
VCGPAGSSAESRKAVQKSRQRLGGGIVLGLCVLVGLLSSAEAVIKIETAEVQNGVAFIKGNGAVLGAQITCEGGAVTTANTNNGGFSFVGVLPEDCQGTLSDGAATVSVNMLNCPPDSDSAPAPVAVTGQTTLFAAGDDGAIQAGVPFPSPRFTDNGNGTVTDNLTGLIWLKNANCFDSQTWVTALNAANNLADDPASTTTDCGLSDGSVAGDWRLPNVKELQSLIDFGFVNPALSNAAGTGQYTATDCAFSGVQSTPYWSSTTTAFTSDDAWVVPGGGLTVGDGFKGGIALVWPVRGANRYFDTLRLWTLWGVQGGIPPATPHFC